eukprot:c6264_g1_i1 orf=47-346(-)
MMNTEHKGPLEAQPVEMAARNLLIQQVLHKHVEVEHENPHHGSDEAEREGGGPRAKTISSCITSIYVNFLATITITNDFKLVPHLQSPPHHSIHAMVSS